MTDWLQKGLSSLFVYSWRAEPEPSRLQVQQQQNRHHDPVQETRPLRPKRLPTAPVPGGSSSGVLADHLCVLFLCLLSADGGRRCLRKAALGGESERPTLENNPSLISCSESGSNRSVLKPVRGGRAGPSRCRGSSSPHADTPQHANRC